MHGPRPWPKGRTGMSEPDDRGPPARTSERTASAHGGSGSTRNTKPSCSCTRTATSADPKDLPRTRASCSATAKRQVIATLYQATGDLIAHDEAALSESAWTRLGLTRWRPHHASRIPAPLDSLSHVRSRIYGHDLSEALAPRHHQGYRGRQILGHSSRRRSSPPARPVPLDHKEILALTHAMVEAGERLRWPAGIVVDKHCVGGLPGNRTTPIVVAIVGVARAHDAEDVVAGDHVAGRNRGRDGDHGAGRIRYGGHSPRGRARGRMRGVGRCGQAEPGR